MFYDSHVTTRAEREALIATNNFKWITVRPEQVVAIDPPPKGGLTLVNHRGKSIVWHEDDGSFEELYFRFMYDVLDAYKRGDKSLYVKLWKGKTGETVACTRADRIHGVFENMRKRGFKDELGDWGGVCVEATGERLDGSYRSAIASYLGIPEIRVKEYAWRWQDVSRSLLERKLRSDFFRNGVDYYAVDFGEGLRNYEGVVPRNCLLNVEKADVIADFLEVKAGERILDLGCNAGIISLNLARRGATVKGVDYTLIDSARLYKLVYEFVEKRDLDATFETGDIRAVEGEYDTVLLLNTLYHLPKEDQLPFLKKLRTMTKRILLQGNLDKKGTEYHNVDVAGMGVLLSEAGFTVKNIKEWHTKPLVLAI